MNQGNQIGDSPIGDSPIGDSHVEGRARDPRILNLAIAITIIHAVVTGLGAASSNSTIRNAVAVVSVVLFFLGAIAFSWAFVVAAGRSRFENLWFGGAFFGSGGVIPPSDRRILLACLVAQCVVGVVGAGLAPFTSVAFSVLVPMAGLGLLALYGAREGEFSPRAEDD